MCSICTEHHEVDFFGAFLLAQIHWRQRQKNPENIENVLLGLTGVMGPRAWAGSLVSHGPSPQAPGIQSVCVRDVREYLCFQGPLLGLISFEHADAVCPHQPLWQHLAEVLYQLRYMGSLNAGCGYVLLPWSPAPL